MEADFYTDSAVRKTLTAGDGERSGSPGTCDSRRRVLFDAAHHAFSGRVTATPSSTRSSFAGAAPGRPTLKGTSCPRLDRNARLRIEEHNESGQSSEFDAMFCVVLEMLELRGAL